MRGGAWMVSIGWVFAALFGGAVLGALAMALVIAGRDDR